MTIKSGLAIASDSRGTPIINQTTEWINGARVYTANATNANASSSDIKRYIGLNNTRTYLPYCKCVNIIGLERTIWPIVDASVYKMNEVVSFKPFSDCIQNVDTFGFGKRKIHRFRKVTDPQESARLSAALASLTLPKEKIQKYIDEAVYLQGLDVDSSDEIKLETKPAPVGCAGLVHFYWLTHRNQFLQIVLENHETLAIFGKEDLLVTYPIHPDASETVVSQTATLIRECFEETIGRTFSVTSLPKIPLEIYEPDTIHSNLPCADQINP